MKNRRKIVPWSVLVCGCLYAYGEFVLAKTPKEFYDKSYAELKASTSAYLRSADESDQDYSEEIDSLLTHIYCEGDPR